MVLLIFFFSKLMQKDDIFMDICCSGVSSLCSTWLNKSMRLCLFGVLGLIKEIIFSLQNGFCRSMELFSAMINSSS